MFPGNLGTNRSAMTRPPIPKVSYLNIANLVSVFRLLVLPAFFYFLNYYILWRNSEDGGGVLAQTFYLIAVALVPVILISDYLDGWLARRYQLVNPLGAFLDPLADKFFAFFAIAILTWAGELPVWLVMVVFFKEVFILIGWMLLFILGYDTDIEPSRTGKTASVCQGIVVFSSLLTLPGGEILSVPWFPLVPLAKTLNLPWFHVITACLTTAAGVMYIFDGLSRAQSSAVIPNEKVALLQVGEVPPRSKGSSEGL